MEEVAIIALETEGFTSQKTVEFEAAPTALNVVSRNGVDILVPKRGTRKHCTVNEILEAVGGDAEPTQDGDFSQQSTYGDNSRLARKLGVSIQTVRQWRKDHPLVDNAMKEEAERDKDWIENIARSQMMAGDSKMTMAWLSAKARDRGWGKENDRYQAPEVSNEALNRRIKELAPRERLRLLAEAHTSGEYEGKNAQPNGKMG